MRLDPCPNSLGQSFGRCAGRLAARVIGMKATHPVAGSHGGHFLVNYLCQMPAGIPFIASHEEVVSKNHLMERNMGKLLETIRTYRQMIWTAVKPDQQTWQGATYGLAAVTLLLIIAFVASVAMGSWALITLAILIPLTVLLAFLSGMLTDPMMGLLNAMPRQYRLVLVGSGVILATMIFSGLGGVGTAALAAAVILFASLLGAGVWGLARRQTGRGLSVFSLLLGAAGLIAGLLWYQWPGPAVTSPPNATRQNAAAIPHLTGADPAQPGPYPVQTLTYGSGQDRHRPEYGAEADLLTPSVNGSPFIDNWQGISGDLRSRYWGFDVSNLPLNGRVWYPDGDGPFPLALIVHGNHFMMDYSDSGYDYLGQLLASRGIILVSVDQNFLNGSWTDIQMFGIEGLKNENNGRGWLLLEHLVQWQDWQADAGNPFYGMVDMERIVLMGHSRGGEAAAIAAAFNRLPAYPDDATVLFNYNFNIRGVVAIAPSDGQYNPTGRSTPLQNINYLVIQGAYDGDVRPFQGIRQYNRVTFDDDQFWFKSAVYVDRANHGQFNTDWGRADRGGFPAAGLLNLAPIMPEAEQQQVAKLFISAFLESVLDERDEYLPLFQDPRRARNWLPETIYLSRYDDSRTEIIADFEEDIDVTTASVEGAFFTGAGLTRWYEKLVELKSGDQQTNAVYLGWDEEVTGETAVYTLSLAESEIRPLANSSLIFSLADANQSPSPQDPLDLTIELVDGSGNTASLPLSHYALLQPQIQFYTLKARFLESRDSRPGEVTFQSYAFPLADFQASNPQFDPDALASIRFVFDRSERGVVVLDEIGFRR
jgi:dienelactone hydrolase